MPSIQIHRFTFSPFQENTYLLSDETKECIIIDPGMYDRAEQHELESYIQEHELKPVQLINTHCHLDHVFGNAFVHRTYGLSPVMHELDLPTLKMAPMSAQLYGIPGFEETPQPGAFFEEGDTVRFGNSELEVLFTPGHAPGHVVLLHRGEQFVIGGDVLFQLSVGRTDLPGGNHEQLLESIRQKLFVLDDAVEVHPGHGPKTNIGFERENNPFLKEGAN